MADHLIILLHPVREPLDQTAVGALELLARMMLPFAFGVAGFFGRPAPGRAPPLAIQIPLRRFKKFPSMTQAGDENSSGLPCHAERVCVCRQ